MLIDPNTKGEGKNTKGCFNTKNKQRNYLFNTCSIKQLYPEFSPHTLWVLEISSGLQSWCSYLSHLSARQLYLWAVHAVFIVIVCVLFTGGTFKSFLCHYSNRSVIFSLEVCTLSHTHTLHEFVCLVWFNFEFVFSFGFYVMWFMLLY